MAEIVQQIVVEDDPGCVVYCNLVLIRGDSPDDAYMKAVELGISQQTSYENPDGKKVTVTYRGLHGLNVIHEELEHGAELIYDKHTDMDEAAIQRFVRTREELGVFAPRRPSREPDFRSKDILQQLQDRFLNIDVS